MDNEVATMSQRGDAMKYADRSEPWYRQPWNEGKLDKTHLPPVGWTPGGSSDWSSDEEPAAETSRRKLELETYLNDPSYIEGRLDYLEGVDYEMYSSSENSLWRLGFLEAKGEFPNFHKEQA